MALAAAARTACARSRDLTVKRSSQERRAGNRDAFRELGRSGALAEIFRRGLLIEVVFKQARNCSNPVFLG